MNVVIYADNTISVDGTITGYAVEQHKSGTRIRPWHNNGRTPPRYLGDGSLPQNRYALSTEAGRADFERDFLAIWNKAPNAETWIAWLDGRKSEAVEFLVPVEAPYPFDLAEAGAKALAVDVRPDLNVQRKE